MFMNRIPLQDWADLVGVATKNDLNDTSLMTTVMSKIAMLEDRLASINKTNVVSVVAEEGASLNQPDADLVISKGETPLTGTQSVVGKSIDIKSLETDSCALKLTTDTGDVSVVNLVTSGNLPKSVNNQQVTLATNGYCTMSDCTFGQTSYNAICTSETTAAKYLIFDNLEFSGKLSNSGISILNLADNSVVTISNCNFARCSNPIRISNNSNVRATINIVNCTFGEMESGEYGGIILFQDYKSASKEEVLANKQFGPDKITVNFTGCTMNGTAVNPERIANVCGTKDANQLFYVFSSKTGVLPYKADLYPTFTFK